MENQQGAFLYKNMRLNLKKKIKAILISSMFILGMVGMNVTAAEGTVFHVENQTGNAGDVVTVPIEVRDGEEVGGFEITVYYDGETMDFQKLEKGDLIDGGDGLFDYNHKEEKASIKIVYVVSDTIKSDGVIVNLTFKLKKDCGKELPIGMDVGEVIDSSEESKELSGEISGVSEPFQKKIEDKVKADKKEKEDSLQVKTVSEETTEMKEDGSKAIDQEEDQKETQGTNKSEQIKDESNTSKTTVDTVNRKVIGIVVILGILVAGGILIWFVCRNWKKK